MNADDSNMAAHAIAHQAFMAAETIRQVASRYELFAVVYRLAPFPDGNQWCVLLGENLQEGVAGFGDTPYEAIIDFETNMHRAKLEVKNGQ